MAGAEFDDFVDEGLAEVVLFGGGGGRGGLHGEGVWQVKKGGRI